MRSMNLENGSRGKKLGRRLATLGAVLVTAALAFGCKKQESAPTGGASPTPGASAEKGQQRFVFITNNSSDFWNIAENDLARIHADMARGFEDGTLRPVVGRELPLADAAVAHRLVLEPGARGKIVLVT